MHILNQISTVIALTTFILANTHASKLPFNGTYFGAAAGPAWGTSNYTTNPGCPGLSANATFCGAAPDPSAANGVSVEASGMGKLRPEGFNATIELGHNWQTGNFVLGGEAAFGALQLTQTAVAGGAFPAPFLGTRYTLTNSISTEWLATIQGRLGAVLKNQVLVYATAGAAFSQLELTASYSDNAVGFGFPGGYGLGRNTSTKAGWVAGGGAELRLSDIVSIKAEYLYVDFNSMQAAVPVSNTPAFTQTMQTSTDLNAQIARIGLNARI